MVFFAGDTTSALQKGAVSLVICDQYSRTGRCRLYPRNRPGYDVGIDGASANCTPTPVCTGAPYSKPLRNTLSVPGWTVSWKLDGVVTKQLSAICMVIVWVPTGAALASVITPVMLLALIPPV